MTNKNTRNFTSSDDALILEQPFTGIGLKTLARRDSYQPRDDYTSGWRTWRFARHQ